jgi:hypothetical protein
MSSNYACLCLNVQFRALLPPNSSPPPSPSDPGYQSLYVGQDGISIVHILPFLFLYFIDFSPGSPTLDPQESNTR